MRHKRAGAFSLMELLVVLSLTGLVLGLVATLVSKTYETMKFLQEKSQTLQSATLGLERLSSELREAVGPVATSPLSFRKVDPQAIEVVGADPLDFVGFELWDRNYGATSELATVLYSDVISPNQLTRRVTFRGNSMDSIVATSVNAFQVARPFAAQNSFEVTLTLEEKRKLVTFTTVVTCPGVAP